LLLKITHDILSDACIGAIASSETYPQAEVDEAKTLASDLGIPLLLLDTHELDNEEFASNPPDRCYLCKSELFGKLVELAQQKGFSFVVDGANADDVFDFRPGARAGRELGIRSPLKEAGFTKNDIRQISKALGLPNWNKPSFACLSSRFPYGEVITRDKLRQLDEAEAYIRSLGVAQLRVRHHGDIARIEVSPSDMETVVTKGEEITIKLKNLGFRYVTLDLLGYRTGSMNETLSNDQKDSALG
jgi:uncharacterized protein